MKIAKNRSRLAIAMLSSAITATALTGLANAQQAMNGHSGSSMKHAEMMKVKVGLDGYCPVCVIEAKKWEKGNPAIQSTFDGISYSFPSQAIKAKFDANPQKYVPALGGDCIVCYEKAGKRIAGSVRHAALHNERLYLFPSDGEKQAFLADPNSFNETDLAAGGECVVCLVKANKHVRGTAKHTVIHNGLRYQFPSANEADAFRQSPQQFVSMMGNRMDSKVGNADAMKDISGMKKMDDMKSNGVRLVGRSGCAACEFGVTPLGSPDELGLAVVRRDGRITVVEGAHASYPQIYKDRFDGQQLAVEGRIVKSQGRIDWLEPTSLQVIN